MCLESKLTLSVVDQSPVRADSTAGAALKETIELAVVADALGYKRYWLAEHHNLQNFAGTSPEILIGHIAARTSNIKVGSGGVMLSHYSSFKVAENFSLLESLYPGRIDLGIGRAPGSRPDHGGGSGLSKRPHDIQHFPQQITDLLGFLSDSLESGHPFAELRTGPGRTTVPEVWLLGSRYESAYLASQLGLPFAYAHFFGIGVEDGPAIVEAYRRDFQPSGHHSEPKVNVGVQVMCAKTQQEARRLAASRDLSRLQSVLGGAKGIPPVEEAVSYPYQSNEAAYIEQYRRVCIDGDPKQVKEGLDAPALSDLGPQCCHHLLRFRR